ncbi:DUF1446 domain-containing protein [Acidobacteria bacterium AH-259-A15]|nr:DUF1446 domain-containing protein [Acidobacteria bacterium AH-259-A15]
MRPRIGNSGSDPTLRVGNAGGYWGDDLDALYRQLTQGPIDYITLDFLAEVTMSILQKQRSRKAELGYATDFLDQMRVCLPVLKQAGTRIITNAGGINPRGCAEELAKIAHGLGIQARIAVVEGDNLMDGLDQLLEKGIPLKNMETGEELHTIRERVQSANAYLGAAPVIKALEEGAEMVITGRVADASITVAPPAFEFEWSLQDWDRLAAAVVAGHILECGAQASGGNLTDWQEVPSFLDMGYPIAEFFSDGTVYVTKHESAGGLVNCQTVTSQLVYEIGDPGRYITPDVIADFSTIVLQDEGNHRVKVSGVKGRPCTDHLKVSISYHGGYKAHGTMIVVRPNALEKCRAMAEMFWKRLELEFQETSTELVGHSACHRHLSPPSDPPEILLRLGARDSNREKVEAFARKFTSLILNSVPGVAMVGARPRVEEILAYWPCLIPASEVSPRVTMLDSGKSFHIPWVPPHRQASPSSFGSPPSQTGVQSRVKGCSVTVPLIELCYARSGDKGDTCNVGVVARSKKIYEWISQELTVERVKDYLGAICEGEVERFELPNLLALNFLLHRCLGGGGTVSLRIDPQGKTLADALLLMQVEVSEDLVAADHV